jgi:hypothetical protein
MARSSILLSLFLVLPSYVFAQKTPIDPPVTDRPADFSNIVGKYDIRVRAEPTEVQVEQPITLRIYLTGEGPEKYEPNRMRLRLFPESWKSDFYVQEIPDQHEVHRDSKTWLFVYRIKPKHTKITAIDDIKLVYYNPNITDKDKFATKYADAIKITVKPKVGQSEKVELPVTAAPDSFFTYVGSKEILPQSTRTFSLTGWQLAIFVVLPPVACFCVIIAWRRYCPDDSQRAIQYRDDSAERALAQLQSGSLSAWAVVCQYLRDRLDYAVADPVPAEIAAFLKRRGFAIARCAQGKSFFQKCDAARYKGSASTDAKHLVDAAAHLIQSLEADPCAHR